MATPTPNELPPLYSNETFVRPEPPPMAIAFVDRLPRWLRLVAALPLSVLPERWRTPLGAERLPLVAGAILTSTIELLLVTGLGYVALHDYLMTEGALIGHAAGAMATDAEVMPGKGVLMGLGVTMFLGFVFGTLAGWLCLALFAESWIRLFAAISGHPAGIFPLWAASESAALGRRWLTRHLPTPRLADLIEPDGNHQGLRLASYRPKDWDKRTTLLYGGERYRVTGVYERATGRRRYGYVLTPVPGWWQVDDSAVVELAAGEAAGSG